MHDDAPTNAMDAKKLTLLCDLELRSGLWCLIPMMHAFDYLVKFSQDKKCFVGDMVSAVILCRTYLYVCNMYWAYTPDAFRSFKDM